MLAVPDRPASLADEAGQFRLALGQQQTREIAAVEMQEIEDIIDEAMAVARLERRLQTREAGATVLVLDHDLAVEQRGTRRKVGDGVGNVRKPLGPVQALAGEQLDLAAIEAGLHAVAVEFDLVHPVRAARRCGAEGCERRRQERRQARAARARRLGTLAGVLGLPRRAATWHTGTAMRRGRPALDVARDTPVRVPYALAALALGDLRNRAAAHHRQRLLLEDVGITRPARGLVLGLDQQPRHLLFPGPTVHAHEMPPPVQLVAVEPKLEVTFLQSPLRIAFRMPAAAVPNQHGSAAILALRDGPFERVVLDRMIFHLNRQALLARNEARTAGHRPALHHAVELEPHVVMQPAGGMLLDDELITLGSPCAPARLRGHVEFALLAINLQAHGENLR